MLKSRRQTNNSNVNDETKQCLPFLMGPRGFMGDFGVLLGDVEVI